MNIMLWLATSLDRMRYDVCSCQFGLETGERTVRFSDGSVMPFAHGETGSGSDQTLFIYEVGSVETLPVDLGPKLHEYRSLPRVGQYLVAFENAACVWSWCRDESGRWPDDPDVVTTLSGTVRLAPLGLSITLADIYARVSCPSDG